jgi:hypothetical protein
MHLSRMTRLFTLEGIAMKSRLFGFALLSLTALVASVPVHAQNGSLTRSFVSSSGVDTDPCTITAPCQSFAEAYTKIGANGIIAALDPGKYGPLNIIGPVTVNGNGWSAITAPAQNNGITINAETGDVTLTGLEIDGARAAYNGIVFNTGSSLTISNCIVKDFVLKNNDNDGTTGNGILMQPTSGTLDFTITNTTASNNGGQGVIYFPTSGSPSANGAIDHVVANANIDGIDVNTFNASGGTTVITISNTIASNNVNGSGIAIVGTAAMKVSIDNVSASGNFIGIQDNFTANVLLGRSVITGNSTGIQNDTSPNSFFTFGDNRINENTTDGYTTLSTSFTTH